MKRSFWVVAAVIAFAAAADAKVTNRTIATVNGEPILQSEFEEKWDAVKEQQSAVMPKERLTADWEKKTKQSLLDSMINDKVLLLEAKKSKAKVNRRELENGTLQIKARFLPDSAKLKLQEKVEAQIETMSPEDRALGPLSIDLAPLWTELQKEDPKAIEEAEAGFKQEMAKEGLTAKTFEDRIRDQILVAQFSRQQVGAQTKSPSDDDARKLYDQVISVMNGKEPKDVDAETLAELKGLAQAFKNYSSPRVRARHILIRVPEDASFKDKASAKRKAQELREKIEKGADFAKIAEAESDDKASAVRGGDLGYFTQGQMVKPFEEAAFKLKAGQLSPVVETDFGYHVIKVEDKKEGGNVPFDEAKEELKQYLYSARAQEYFDDYVEKLRKAASVKVLVEPGSL